MYRKVFPENKARQKIVVNAEAERSGMYDRELGRVKCSFNCGLDGRPGLGNYQL